jgi:hypothetical protein
MNKKSKFMLVLILCSIMLIVSVNAQSSKNKGKTKTNQTNSKPIEFDQKEFNLEVEKLPINYLGHNPAELYRRIIDRRKLSKKGEFEKTVDFNKRIEEAERKPYFGNLNKDSLFAFLIPEVDSQYNADEERLSLIQRAFHNSPTPPYIEDGHIEPGDVFGRLSKRTYYIRNIVDILDVNSQETLTFSIDVKELPEDFKLPKNFDKNELQQHKYLYSYIEANVEQAKRLKEDIRGLVIFKLTDSLIKTLYSRWV